MSFSMKETIKIIKTGIIASLLLTTSIYASEESPNPERIEAAIKLQKDLGVGETYTNALMGRVDEMVGQRPELEKVKDKIKKYMIEKMGWDTIKDDRAKIYAKYFTVEEMRIFGEFFKSEAGQKILKTLPQLDREEGMLIQKKVREMLPGMTKILQEAVESSESAADMNDSSAKAPQNKK